MRRLFVALTLTLLAAGCASSDAQSNALNEAGIPNPLIEIAQSSRVPYVARDATGPITVQYVLSVKNRAAVPIELRGIEISSMAGGAYDLSPTSHSPNIEIAPGATGEARIWAPANVPMQTVAGANGPVTLRIRAIFEANGKPFETFDVKTVNPYGE